MPLDETLHGRYIYDVMHVRVLQYIRTGAIGQVMTCTTGRLFMV